MALIDTDKLSTIADYAAILGVTGQTLSKWLEEEGVKPALVAGNTRLFDVDELAKVAEGKNTSLSKLKALGYVHPDQYKDMQDLHASAVREAIDLAKQLANYREIISNYEARLIDSGALDPEDSIMHHND